MPYGLAYTGLGAHRVVAAASASLNNIATGTAMWWLYPTAAPNGHHLMNKPGTQSMRARLGATYFEMYYGGSTGDVAFSRDISGFAHWGTNKWVKIACHWSFGGSSGDQKLWMGDLSNAIAEPDMYDEVLTGSGSHDDSAGDLIIGNHASNNAALAGTLACMAIYNSILTEAQMNTWFARPSAIVKSGCLGSWIFGDGGSTGSQLDRSGNGNHGTVTGASASGTQLGRVLHRPLVNNDRHPLLTGLVG